MANAFVRYVAEGAVDRGHQVDICMLIVAYRLPPAIAHGFELCACMSAQFLVY
jgi:hypothetical protein